MAVSDSANSDSGANGESGKLGPRDLPLDQGMRSQVLEAIASKMDAYAFPDVAKKVQADIRDR